MRLITKDVYYALRALFYMVQFPDEMVSVNILVGRLKLSRTFMRKIMQDLSKHKILRSRKGKNGGFSLNVRPESIRVFDIVKIFKRKIEINNCLIEKGICPRQDKCPLMGNLKNIQKDVYKALKNTTLAELFRAMHKCE